jgi:hypothetical protein
VWGRIAVYCFDCDDHLGLSLVVEFCIHCYGSGLRVNLQVIFTCQAITERVI